MSASMDILLAIKVVPGSSNLTSTTYRSAGAITTDSTQASRSKRPTSDAMSFTCAEPNVTLNVLELATFVRKKRTTSPCFADN